MTTAELLALERGAGPDPAELARWVAWWQDREAAFERHAPPELRGLEEAAPTAWPPDVHTRLDRWFPWDELVRVVHAQLEAWYGAALERRGVPLASGALARARSWLEARRRLPAVAALGQRPSQLVAALADPELASQVVWALFAPPVLGARLDRYGPELRRLAEQLVATQAQTGPWRLWDAGTASGEGAWALAAAVLEQAPPKRSLQVVGSDRCPLVIAMAEARQRPHEPRAGQALAEFLAARPQLLDPDRVRLRFAVHDLLEPAPWSPQHAVTCHGVLGESLRGPALAHAVARLAAALAPGGLLQVGDRFRDDVSAEARAAVKRAASQAGLESLGEGLFRARARHSASPNPSKAPT